MKQMIPFIHFRIDVLALIFALTSVILGPAICQEPVIMDKMLKEIVAGRMNQTQIPPLTKTYGLFTIEDAYQIQAALAKELSKNLGSVAGYKVAFASKAVREQFGIDEPASGPFFQLQRVPNGSKLPANAFLEITMETEIAFTINNKIDQAIKNVQELKEYVKWVHVAFDMGNYCYLNGEGKPKLQDEIATGVGAHYFALGPAIDPRAVNVDVVNLKLSLNGKNIAESAATNVMGSPWNSLFWLANHIVNFGGTLEPGDVVLTGTAAPAYKAKGDQIKGQYEGDAGTLGKVTLTVF